MNPFDRRHPIWQPQHPIWRDHVTLALVVALVAVAGLVIVVVKQ